MGSARAAEQRPRGRAWLLSAATAAVMIICGFHVALDVLRNGFIPEVVYSSNRHSRFTCAFFATFMILDTVVGVLDYPDYFDLLTGWIHHAFYLTLIVALFYHGATHAQVHGFIEEIPVLILALGNLHPALRRDLLFGFTFFVMRILYHIYLTVNFCSHLGHKHPAVYYSALTSVLALLLHLYWFAAWSKNLPAYLALARRRHLQEDKQSQPDKRE
jgi:hypothetical protein